MLDGSINVLLQIMTMLPGIFIFLIIVAVATFLIVKDREIIKTFLARFLPGQAKSKTSRIVSELIAALMGFLKAYSILISITAITTMVALKILHVKYVLTIGLVVGLCDILPVLVQEQYLYPG